MNYIGTSQVLVQKPATSRTVAHSVYRPDIDGLRAIAVLAVVMTHARIAHFSGGFIGVDVFFVISGFLIFRNLGSAQKSGRFGFWSFYGRRLRRTLPALYLVAALSFAAALVLFMPGDLDAFARSLVALLLFVPNMLFATQTAYFDPGAISKPLLHTWSLGVEEQFYALAPLLPLGLSRLGPRNRKIALLILFVVGLGFCILWRHFDAQEAFYLMPMRLWEFLAGCIVAEGMFPPIHNDRLAEAVAGVALCILLACLTLFSKKTPHPGLLTLLPCLATAAIIHIGATKRTAVGRLLGSPVPVAIGLMSYSIYLWHWPLIVFLRYADVRPTPAVWIAGAVSLFGLSFLSWRFVEIPFRAQDSLLRRRACIILPATGLLLAATSLTVSLARGLPERFPAAITAIAHYYYFRDTRPFREGQCFITSKNSFADFDQATCLRLDPRRRNVMLLGDSHAAHLWTALRDRWPDTNFLQATASGCMPLVGTTGDDRCTELMDEMLKHFLPKHRLDGIIISGYWDKSDIKPLEATIAYLKPLVGEITIFGPSVLYDEPLSTLLANAVMHHDLASVQRHQRRRIPPLDSLMEKAIAPLATYVSTYQAMCPSERCQLFAAPGVPMQFDDQHLTPQGAALLVKDILAHQSLQF